MRKGRVEISPGFLLLAAWLNYMDRQGIFVLTLIGCVFHELCHLGILRLCKVPIRCIRITAVGAEIRVDRGMSYLTEMGAALAGPLGNLFLAFLASRVPGGALFAGVNLALGLFNLVPAGRLDGGRFLYCALSLLLGPEWGERVSGLISNLCLAVLCLAGGWSFGRRGSLTLALISIWMVFSLKDIAGYWRKWVK